LVLSTRRLIRQIHSHVIKMPSSREQRPLELLLINYH